MGMTLFMRKGNTHTVPFVTIQASTLAVGTVVNLMENGVAAEYLVVNQGKPSNSSLYDDSCDGTWLLRKDCYESRQWHSSDVNDYQNSTIHSYLNSTFYDLFGTAEKSVINQVKIPYVNGTSNSAISSGSNGLSTRIFLLSGYEVGFTVSNSSYFPADGAKLSYFENGTGSSAHNKRIAYLDDSATCWWLRSATTGGVSYAWSIQPDGRMGYIGCSNSYGIRPCIVVSGSALFNSVTMVLEEVV